MQQVVISLITIIALSLDWAISTAQDSETLAEQRPATTAVKQKEQKQKPTKDAIQKVEQSGDPEDLLSENQKRALYRLRSLQNELKEIDDHEVKIKLQAQVADALWGFDKSSSRRLFLNAYEEIENIKGDSDKNKSSKLESKGRSHNESLISIKTRLRSYVIHLVSSRDIDLADKLSSSHRKSGKPISDLQEDEKEISMQRLRLAVNIAQLYPEQALAITKDEIKHELSENSMGALIVIRRYHSKITDLAFQDLLSWVGRSSSHLSYNSLGILGMYLLGAEREKDDSSGIGIRPETIREYLKYAHRVVEHNIQNNLVAQSKDLNQTYTILQNLLPLFESYLPEEASKLRFYVNGLGSSINQQVKEQLLPEKPADPSSVDDLLSLAEREANTERRDSVMTKAAFLATSQGDIDKALFIAHKLNDERRKKRTISAIYYQFARRAISAKEMEQALKYAREVIIPVQQWMIFLAVSEWHAAKKNNDKVAETLTEIENYIKALPDDDPEKAWGLFVVSKSWSRFDMVRGIDSMRIAIKYLNSADFNKPQLEGRTRITSDNFADGALWAYLANADFDKALFLAHSIQDKSISSIAQVLICKALFSTDKEMINK